jgi:hypothetical protein
MRRTIYVVLADKRTGRRLGVKRLKDLARDVAADIPRGYLDRYRGDYIAGGTRFGVTPDDDSMTPVPCMKIRADDDIRAWIVTKLAVRHRVLAIAGHDRKLIGGRR